MAVVTELHIYPVKSLGGYQVAEAKMSQTGLGLDRRWLIVDENNQFVTQREIPAMVKLRASVHDGHLELHAESDSIQVYSTDPAAPTVMVDIWSDRCRAQTVAKEVNEWLCESLKMNCQLVFMPDTTHRYADSRYAMNKELTSFADTFPVSMISMASLRDLNDRLNEPVPMNRFRPNIVIDQCAPFEEDSFGTFDVGSIRFRSVKKIGRCLIVNIDQESSETFKEPLKTLATYRSANNKVYFGQCLLAENTGSIRVGDQITT